MYPIEYHKYISLIHNIVWYGQLFWTELFFILLIVLRFTSTHPPTLQNLLSTLNFSLNWSKLTLTDSNVLSGTNTVELSGTNDVNAMNKWSIKEFYININILFNIELAHDRGSDDWSDTVDMLDRLSSGTPDTTDINIETLHLRSVENTEHLIVNQNV